MWVRRVELIEEVARPAVRGTRIREAVAMDRRRMRAAAIARNDRGADAGYCDRESAVQLVQQRREVVRLASRTCERIREKVLWCGSAPRREQRVHRTGRAVGQPAGREVCVSN